MANYEFASLKGLKKFIDNEAMRDDRYKGSVLLPGFNLDEECAVLREDGWPVSDIIEYIITANTCLWALVWLKNPQKPTEPIQLYDYQKTLLNCQNRFKLSRCGRQVGKTVCMCIDMIYFAMTNEHMRILYAAPYMSHVMTLVDQTLRPLINDVPEIANSITKTQTHPFHSFKLKNGSVIEAMTAGSGSKKGVTIRGKSADRLYLDEMDYMGSDTMAAVSASMVSRPNSKLWVSSTPSGRREEFFHYSMDNTSRFKCTDCENEEVALIHTYDNRDIKISGGTPFYFPSHVSPMFTADTDDFYKTSYSQLQYQHEILAEWGEELEGVFRHEDIDVCLQMGRVAITLDSGEETEISYEYEQITPNPGCKYIMGVDWNGEARGVHICIIELNDSPDTINGLPSKMFRVVKTEIVTGETFSENNAVTRILKLTKDYLVSYIYADEGYGTIYIEVLKKMAMNAGMNFIAEIIRPINLQSTANVYDPLTRETLPKHMKPFMVNNAARIVEAKRIILPDCEDEKIRLVGQMREYLVINRSDTGRPIYSKDNEDMLTAFMMALLGFILEYSDLANLPGVNNIEVEASSPLNRAMDYITPRNITPSLPTSLFQRYGAKQRKPAFQDMARSMGLDYDYTTDSRPEELRPYIERDVKRDIGSRYSKNIDSDDSSSRRQPSRKLFRGGR